MKPQEIGSSGCFLCSTFFCAERKWKNRNVDSQTTKPPLPEAMFTVLRTVYFFFFVAFFFFAVGFFAAFFTVFFFAAGFLFAVFLAAFFFAGIER
jgi:hypothetical protein